MTKTRLPEIISENETRLLNDWVHQRPELLSTGMAGISEQKLRSNAQRFLHSLVAALGESARADMDAPAWSGMRELLTEFSRERAVEGFSPSETAMFVFSFKQPLLARIGDEYSTNAEAMRDELWRAIELLDKLGLYTTEIFQKTREEVILRQQQEMLELSTPVVELWNGLLALPLIGTLDSARTQIVMQNLLEAIVEKGADLAIIDITGVPTVDTLVAQHLLKTVAAARLMGTECIISGIRPQIAQTIIHLGVDLSGVLTKATLADAFQLALRKKNLTIVKA